MEKEVKELLDVLEEYGRDQRQKRQIVDLIDGLAAKETRRKTIPLWLKTVIGAAACALLLLTFRMMQKPTETEQSEIVRSTVPKKEMSVDSNLVKETTRIEPVEARIVEHSDKERQIAEAQNIVQQVEKENETIQESAMFEIVENQCLVQNDTLLVAQLENVFEDTMQFVDVQPVPAKRRVVRTDNLVTYGNPVRKHLDRKRKSGSKEKGVIGLPQYSASEGCMLAFEINTDLHD